MKHSIGLILENQEMLYKVAKSRLKNEEDICDAVQETLISAYKSIKSLKNNKYFKTWLIRILINKCNDMYARKGTKDISIDTIQENKEMATSDFTNEFGIDYIIQSLNVEEQTILTLYYSEGYNEKEISKILDIKYATIRTKIRRAKEKIIQKLEKEVI